MVVCATNVQLNVYNMDTCHKNDGLNLDILKLLYLICRNPTLAKCGGEAQHLEKVRI